MTTVNLAKQRGLVGDDKTLAQRAQSDSAAFDALYRRYVRRVYRYCYTHSGSAADAEDLTAQTFLAALESIGRFRGRGTFAAWLFGIAWRKCKDHHRQRYRKPQERLDEAERLPNPEAVNLERHAYNQDILECVQTMWNHLSEDRQEVLRLRFWAGLNTAETANVMGRSRAAVKMLLSRAVADIRKRCLDE